LYGAYPVTFPAQIQDVKGAVRWLRAHADLYHLDPTRFASFGPSAGGHLSELLALSGGASELEGDVGGNLAFSSEVQAAAAYFGASDILCMSSDLSSPPAPGYDPDDPTSPESALLGWDGPGQGLCDIKAHLTDPTAPYPALALLVQQCSPLAWVDANDPPLFIAHGTNDTTVPTNQSTRLSAALYSAGVVHELRNVPGAGHGFGTGPVMDAIDLAAANFLRAKLVGPDLPPVGEQSCFGDSSGAACPCGNQSWSGARLGCKNSLAVGGSLTAVGTPSIANDQLVLHGDSMTKGAVLFIQGTQKQVAGSEIVFQSGLRCVSDNVVRLAIQNSVAGSSQYPAVGQPSVSVRGGASPGETLHYQLWYRDGGSTCGGTWNLSNALTLTWLP
jgi:dienelactone hydrolase